MQVIHKLKMDLLRQNNTQIIDAVQLDSNTRKLELSLYEGAMPWAVPDGVLVAIAYMCDDGTRGVYDTLQDDSTAYEIDGNKITITIIPDALAVVGETKMTIIVSSSESKEDSIATFPVTFRVAENYSVEAKDPEGYVNLMGWLESDHILPVATPNRLGGVKPVAATNEMTQPVGVTQNGKLVTAPGGSAGSGGSDVVGWKQIFDFEVKEEVSAVTIDVSEAAPLMKKALYARVVFFAAKVSSADVIGTKPSGTIVWTCDGISNNTWINNGKIMPRIFQTSGDDGGHTIYTCWTIFNTIESVADFVILPANRSPESRVFNIPFNYTYREGKEITIQITANDSAIGVGSYLKIYVAG